MPAAAAAAAASAALLYCSPPKKKIPFSEQQQAKSDMHGMGWVNGKKRRKRRFNPGRTHIPPRSTL